MAGPAAQALALTPLLSAAVDLLEHGGHNAQEGHDQACEGEEQRDGLPQGTVAGKTRLQTAAYKGHTTRHKREKQESRGKDVQISGHFFYFIARSERSATTEECLDGGDVLRDAVGRKAIEKDAAVALALDARVEQHEHAAVVE